jgi:excisionase family DNA binding protein
LECICQSALCAWLTVIADRFRKVESARADDCRFWWQKRFRVLTLACVSSRYLTLVQAAERIATPAETVRYWVHLGKLPAFKPGRQVLIRESDLDAFVEACAIGAVRAAKAKLARGLKKRA